MVQIIVKINYLKKMIWSLYMFAFKLFKTIIFFPMIILNILQKNMHQSIYNFYDVLSSQFFDIISPLKDIIRLPSISIYSIIM
jgi:hypothetical protein